MIFWNGAVSFMIREIVQGFARDRPEWFLVFFSIPFVLVGVFSDCGLYELGPGTVQSADKYSMSRSRIHAGDVAGNVMTLTGRAERLRELTIRLVGEERATYTRGTDTVTDAHDMHNAELFNSKNFSEMRSGRVSLEIPKSAMHSFKANHNEIRWGLTVKGEIEKWPDMDDALVW